jgi:predicted esterase
MAKAPVGGYHHLTRALIGTPPQNDAVSKPGTARPAGFSQGVSVAIAKAFRRRDMADAVLAFTGCRVGAVSKNHPVSLEATR